MLHRAGHSLERFSKYLWGKDTSMRVSAPGFCRTTPPFRGCLQLLVVGSVHPQCSFCGPDFCDIDGGNNRKKKNVDRQPFQLTCRVVEEKKFGRRCMEAGMTQRMTHQSMVGKEDDQRLSRLCTTLIGSSSGYWSCPCLLVFAG